MESLRQMMLDEGEGEGEEGEEEEAVFLHGRWWRWRTTTTNNNNSLPGGPLREEEEEEEGEVLPPPPDPGPDIWPGEAFAACPDAAGPPTGHTAMPAGRHRREGREREGRGLEGRGREGRLRAAATPERGERGDARERGERERRTVFDADTRRLSMARRRDHG